MGCIPATRLARTRSPCVPHCPPAPPEGYPSASHLNGDGRRRPGGARMPCPFGSRKKSASANGSPCPQVDWYPWGPEAIEAARAQDKPIFLSVGYSTCHWCHVMERESFEGGEAARLLNAHFVPIKAGPRRMGAHRSRAAGRCGTYLRLACASAVWCARAPPAAAPPKRGLCLIACPLPLQVDREERPDVDRVYVSGARRGGGPQGHTGGRGAAAHMCTEQCASGGCALPGPLPATQAGGKAALEHATTYAPTTTTTTPTPTPR